MSRPPLEVADIIRSAGAAFIERNRQWIGWKHVKVPLAIARCRTAALGGHVDECTRCGHRATIPYNSCRNRHRPKCQTAAREQMDRGASKGTAPDALYARGLHPPSPEKSRRAMIRFPQGYLPSSGVCDREVTFRRSSQSLRSRCNPAPQRRRQCPSETASSCLRASGPRGCLV